MLALCVCYVSSQKKLRAIVIAMRTCDGHDCIMCVRGHLVGQNCGHVS